jgi:hypothetical protein
LTGGQHDFGPEIVGAVVAVKAIVRTDIGLLDITGDFTGTTDGQKRTDSQEQRNQFDVSHDFLSVILKSID